MKLIEELRTLDPRDPGRWPLAVRVGAVLVWTLVLALVRSYVLVWQQEKPELEQRQLQERSLREELRKKHSKAVNLEVYRQQLKDIERSFGALLRQLPGKTEVSNVLVDISQTATAAGLEIQRFEPQQEQKREFYAEQPLRIRLTGSYHQFGAFVSDIAKLPRIVTLHDIDIKPVPGREQSYDNLTLDLTAKTYRYLDEDELAGANRAQKTPVRRP